VLVLQTAELFAEAGTRPLAYALRGHPQRLWRIPRTWGYGTGRCMTQWCLWPPSWNWPPWDLRAVKLWSTFIEPPGLTRSQTARSGWIAGERTQFPTVSDPSPAAVVVRQGHGHAQFFALRRGLG
jgi:hypothetical protein